MTTRFMLAFLAFWRGVTPGCLAVSWWLLITSNGWPAALYLFTTLEMVLMFAFWWSDIRDWEATK